MNEIANFIDFYCKFDHSCSIEKVDGQVIITNKSVKVECLKCHRVLFYRRIGDFQKL
jgi:hypothetical protein